ncbi:MAG: sodium-dependent transporter [Desulfovibrionaceae bacterium]|nr:sodium-dependent transporter [Desulfovibrionaceae bacterium]
MAIDKGAFTSSIGFVLAAAGSAIGLGNIWRFPYLTAQHGGGLFLLVYLVLLLTFGIVMLTTEIAIGRKTKKSPLYAYNELSPKGGWIGGLATLIPFLIFPYYCVITGWVMKYCILFLFGASNLATEPNFFTGFITSKFEPILYLTIVLATTSFVIYKGVAGGIERISILLMPLLFILIIGISIFAITIHHEEGGVTRTGLQALAIYLTPNTHEMTFVRFLQLCMAAVGQLFYSISIAMGIMVAYGSYFEDKGNIFRSVSQIAFFDTLVAFLAGIMIIVPFIVFMGEDALVTSGPSLLFVSVPKLFARMGAAGPIVGSVFFLMAFFAALTSAISLMEAVVASLMERLSCSREKATVVEGVLAFAVGLLVCLGYNVLYFECPLPTGSVGQILDLLDFASCNILMPIVAIATCALIGWIVGTKTIVNEVTKNGERFLLAPIYSFIIRYAAPIILFILLIQCLGIIK